MRTDNYRTECHAYLVTGWLMTGGYLCYAAFAQHFSGDPVDICAFVLFALFAPLCFPLVAALLCFGGSISFWQQHQYLPSLACLAAAVAICFLVRGVWYVLYRWNRP